MLASKGASCSSSQSRPNSRAGTVSSCSHGGRCACRRRTGRAGTHPSLRLCRRARFAPSAPARDSPAVSCSRQAQSRREQSQSPPSRPLREHGARTERVMRADADVSLLRDRELHARHRSRGQARGHLRASRGNGRAVGEALAARGVDVIGTSRNPAGVPKPADVSAACARRFGCPLGGAAHPQACFASDVPQARPRRREAVAFAEQLGPSRWAKAA
jgi:hypothetical protein